jgi:hypothetical protein
VRWGKRSGFLHFRSLQEVQLILPEAATTPRDHASEADSFDLDANMMNVMAAHEESLLGPSLVMIKEPTVPGNPKRAREQHQPSMGDSLRMLLEPSLPPQPRQIKSKAKLESRLQIMQQPSSPPAPRKTRSKTQDESPSQVLLEPSLPPQPRQPRLMAKPEAPAKRDIHLAQGRSNLTMYFQAAESQFRDTPPANQEQLVNAFVQGLRDKRDKKKCEKRLKEAGKTWQNVKECFPVASQHSESLYKDKASCEEKMEDIRRKRRSDFPARTLPNVKNTFEEDAAKESEVVAAERPHAKKRRTKKPERRLQKAPMIPILPSSEDEFSRGGLKRFNLPT